ILTGPQHWPYKEFCPGPGHQIGFNELKPVELRDFLHAIRDGSQARMCFDEALKIERFIYAVADSAATGTRVTL
ncbi:MAG: gfo/Idh/MocA family oxidoreductase, partial [Pseudomonadota bacterium]